MRKRRQRSQSSPEDSWNGHSNSTPIHDGTLLAPSTSSWSDRTPQPGDGHLSLRRREANRLAAQRFRSRKKGYQDSLENKIRQLEEDKELLVRHLTVGTDGRNVAPPSPAIDVAVCVAALESANRQLQDELTIVGEDNDELREELEQWRRWEREQREASRAAGERVSTDVILALIGSRVWSEPRSYLLRHSGHHLRQDIFVYLPFALPPFKQRQLRRSQVRLIISHAQRDWTAF